MITYNDECPVDGCELELSFNDIMCHTHWMQLSQRARDGLLDARFCANPAVLRCLLSDVTKNGL